MARTQKTKPAELWMAEVITERRSDSYKRIELFGPFTRRGDAVGAATRAKVRSDLYDQTVEYYAAECRWTRRV